MLSAKSAKIKPRKIKAARYSKVLQFLFVQYCSLLCHFFKKIDRNGSKLSIPHLPWHAKTKRFVSVYKSFVSPQTIADIQDVLVKPLNTLKSIREAQGSALLTRKHQEVLYWNAPTCVSTILEPDSTYLWKPAIYNIIWLDLSFLWWKESLRITGTGFV